MTTQLRRTKTETSHYDVDDECMLRNNHKLRGLYDELHDDYMIGYMMTIIKRIHFEGPLGFNYIIDYMMTIIKRILF